MMKMGQWYNYLVIYDVYKHSPLAVVYFWNSVTCQISADIWGIFYLITPKSTTFPNSSHYCLLDLNVGDVGLC